MSASVAVGLGEAIHDAAGDEDAASERLDGRYPAGVDGLMDRLTAQPESPCGLRDRIDL